MIVSGHIILEEELSYMKDDECLLSNCVRFKDCTDFEDNDIDGNYILYDRKKKVFVRTGMVSVGIICRWQEHTTSSMLINHTERNNIFFFFIPT